jgi:serine/threonine protein phosphatase PrpC
MAGAAIGKVLAKGLTQGLAKNVGKNATNSGALRKAAKTKGLENLRQSSIIEAQKAKEKAMKKKGFKETVKKAKANKQKTFTFDGIRFQTANY